MDIAGVDGCRAGWLVLIAADEGRLVLREEPRIVADFDALLALTGACAAIAVDMPIGLSAGRAAPRRLRSAPSPRPAAGEQRRSRRGSSRATPRSAFAP